LNNQEKEKSFFKIDFLPRIICRPKGLQGKRVEERKLSAFSHTSEFLLCAKAPGNKKPEKVKFPRSRQLSPLASAASYPINRDETRCHPPEEGYY